jgi:hypothetical protein
MKNIEWSGKIPDCDICKAVPGPYDVKTIFGPWANLCSSCMDAVTDPAGRHIGTKKVPKS